MQKKPCSLLFYFGTGYYNKNINLSFLSFFSRHLLPTMMKILKRFVKKQPEHENLPIYDAHCHIFNLKFFLYEMISVIKDVFISKYPLTKSETDNEKINVKIKVFFQWILQVFQENFKKEEKKNIRINDFIQWLIEFANLNFGSEEKNLNFLLSNLSQFFHAPKKEIHIIPMMMDIYFIFAYKLDKHEEHSNILQKITRNISNTKNLSRIRELILKAFHKSVKDQKHFDFIKNIVDDVFIEKSEDELQSSALQSAVPCFWTKGFKLHMDTLMELVSRYQKNQKLYPFFAIDPRRTGIVDYVINEKIVSNAGPFYGIKLYPRLGFHPMAKPLLALYHYCADHNIPITTHTSPGGFPQWSTKYEEFGNPLNFEPVLKRYTKRLRINFAHFGNGSDEWAATIRRFMKIYKSVFSDLSCYVEKKDLTEFKAKYWDDPMVQKRTMFASDYDVIYFMGLGTIQLDRYYNLFKDVFDSQELNLLSSIVPQKFLFGK